MHVQQVPVSAEAAVHPAAPSTQRKASKAIRVGPPHVSAEVKQAVQRFAYLFDPALFPRVSCYALSATVSHASCSTNDAKSACSCICTCHNIFLHVESWQLAEAQLVYTLYNPFDTCQYAACLVACCLASKSDKYYIT